jgi:hypothetical protein
MCKINRFYLILKKRGLNLDIVAAKEQMLNVNITLSQENISDETDGNFSILLPLFECL